VERSRECRRRKHRVSPERQQNKKQLLEYDDVMNKQRNVVYSKRNHALFGERLALDLDNAFYSVSEGLVNSFKESNDHEDFKLAVIMNFGIDTTVPRKNWKKEW